MIEARSARLTIDREGLAAAAALGCALLWLSWLRHRNHWTGFDLAIFDQGAWQISQGRDQISIVERHVMADHFSPVLYLFGALYVLVGTPAWLFAGQAVALGATVLPMRAVARRFGQPPGRATALVVFSGPLLAAGLFDFHPITLAVPFLAATVLYAIDDRPVAVALAAAAAALCRADIAVVLIAVCVIAAPRARSRLLAVGVIAAVVSAVVPGRFGDTSGWAPHFGHLGSSPLQAALHPWDVARELLGGGSLSTYALWVLAAGVALVVRPRWLIAVAVAGLPVLLSRWEGTGLPWYHYGAPMAPVAIAGTLEGLSIIAARDDRWARRLKSIWWLGPVLVLLLASPLSPVSPEANRAWTVWFDDDGRDVDGAVALVRPAEAVSADQHVLAQLSQRELADVYPIPFAEAGDLFAEGSGPDPSRWSEHPVDVVIATEGHEELVPLDQYEVIARLDGFVVLRRLGAAE